MYSRFRKWWARSLIFFVPRRRVESVRSRRFHQITFAHEAVFLGVNSATIFHGEVEKNDEKLEVIGEGNIIHFSSLGDTLGGVGCSDNRGKNPSPNLEPFVSKRHQY